MAIERFTNSDFAKLFEPLTAQAQGGTNHVAAGADNKGVEQTRLTDLWLSTTRKSVLLWHLPWLEAAPERLLELAAAALRRTCPELGGELSDGWVRMPAPPQDDPQPRVHRVRSHPGGDGLSAFVRLVKKHQFQFEDEVNEELVTSDVGLRISSGAQRPLVKVFAGYTDARKALLTFLTWLMGEPIPERGPRQAHYVRPFGFSERHVKNLAQRLALRSIAIQGRDAAGRVGEMMLEGRASGDEIEALDLSIPLVRDQDLAPQDVRTYGYVHSCADPGIPEKTRVSFVLRGRQPHLSFPLRTTLAAIDALVAELQAEVRGGS